MPPERPVVPYIIRGYKAIAEFCGCSPNTVMKWSRIHGFPIAKMPNGDVATTPGLIDNWMVARREVQRENGSIRIGLTGWELGRVEERLARKRRESSSS